MSIYQPGPVVVRGRDFTAYRIGGAIVAALLFVALCFQVWELFDGDARTVPEVSWIAADNTPDVGGMEASEVIIARTKLLDERWRTGPSPEGEIPDLALRSGVVLNTVPIEDPSPFLTEAWATPDNEALPMIKPSDRVAGISSLPYPAAEIFERPFARDWRVGIADLVTHLGALAILGFSFLLALLLAIRGRVPIVEGRSRRCVKRFGLIERATHWMTSVSFIMLALTGITIAYGKTLLLPFGEEFLGDAGWLSTWGHMMFFPPFALGLVIMAGMWLRHNLPSRLDIEWLRRAGGMMTDSPDHPSARKFNAGQKLIFWSAVLGGGLMVATGIVLMVPFYFFGVDGMSWTMLAHATIGLMLIAIFIAHIYIGTVGMQGAIDAMWQGDVDRNWAKEHHDLWLAEIEGKQPEGTR
ncbi:formate dehydrogenase subunit gamma [Sagittula salina]|uniref:Formate dehydrogenase subunit gamma n=1 Tax=Sagittula salina TaxID=2820268 RepID=A0A940MT40_9RHOB|nr:formate dehydrogenase subunit gamma [Sagittula salina]MBP0484552.1 formate dehydrogenase subunit gamma [Sagittula salina]